MKKMILTSILTFLSASIASAGFSTENCAGVKEIVKQINDKAQYTIIETTSYADVVVEIDDTRSYSCDRAVEGLVVKSIQGKKNFIIGMVKISNGNRLPIDTISIDAGSGIVKLNLQNTQTPFVGINLNTNSLILLDGRQIPPQ